ncbi:MAG: hypothetical protein NC079_10160 [Clostridium sp.]|nr:hypothetical protein [Acetatifactor muris]MCM1527717.1 hypothetical protein [Bacteroides sp.]MCM1563955.1 hypothetical protein [Clostridium sp.]
MGQKWRNILILPGTAVLLIFVLWGPEAISTYRDKTTLNQVTAEPLEEAGEGYRYSLGSNERLYILAKCLNSQSEPRSERSSILQTDADSLNYEEISGTYAFVVNRQGPSDKEITEEDIFRVCNEQLQDLQERGILPDEVKEVTASGYSAVLYSAIDVLEPRNNVSVWKVSMSTDKRNADKTGRMLDAYIDAETGRLYEFYVRTGTTWQDMDPGQMIDSWAEYMELSAPEEYDSDNPLLENTPYFKKYRFGGTEDGSTVVTLGFYEGINELYLKITR